MQAVKLVRQVVARGEGRKQGELQALTNDWLAIIEVENFIDIIAASFEAFLKAWSEVRQKLLRAA